MKPEQFDRWMAFLEDPANKHRQYTGGRYFNTRQPQCCCAAGAFFPANNIPIHIIDGRMTYQANDGEWRGVGHYWNYLDHDGARWLDKCFYRNDGGDSFVDIAEMLKPHRHLFVVEEQQ